MAVSAVLIADDLTGALDSVEPFARLGLSASVAVDIAGIPEALARGCEVVAVNTDGRALDADTACARIRAAWDALAPRAPMLVIKKVDSRMKGHVAAEADALARASGRSAMLVCPAIPGIGRLVELGAVTGFGVADPIVIADRLKHAVTPFSVPDCVDAEAMAATAEQLLAEPQTLLAVGARGLAEALALSLARRAPRPVRLDAWNVSGPMLVVIGSRDPITSAQVDRLVRGHAGAMLIEAPDGMLAPHAIPDRAELLILRATDGGNGLDPLRVAGRLAIGAVLLARARGVRTFLGCGGDTTRAIARELGIACLVPVRAAAPGVPVSVGEGSDGRHVLISKSGGFGDADILLDIAARTIGAAARADAPARTEKGWE